MSGLRDQVAEVKRAANIVDVISSFVRLRRAGRNYVGLCPFHADKDPSFTVNEAKGFFYCFGCKAGGDVVSFIKLYRNCTYYEALQELAERYGIELKKFDSAAKKKEKDREELLLEANKIAAQFYNKILLEEPQGLQARIYLKERNIPMSIVREQKLGYAPNKWDYLLRYFDSQGISVNIALTAGLVVEHRKNVFRDRFRHRLMFPIRNSRGQIIAFGGRTLDDNIPPKYLNSPETPIYHKSRVLYCYHIAREECRKERRVLVVEGYMDLLRLHVHGVRNVVATLGTALTRQHVRLMDRIADEAIMVFDGDESGIKAATRSLEMFLLEQFPARCVILPENLDPDDFVEKYGAEKFKELVNNAGELTDFFIEQRMKAFHGTLESKSKLVDELLPVIRNIPNPVIRGIYINKIAEKTGIPESAISERFKVLKSGYGRTRFRKRKKIENGEGIDEVCSLEESVLKVLLHNPGFLSLVDADRIMSLFSNERLRSILAAMVNIWKEEKTIDLDRLVVELASQGNESVAVDLWMTSECWNTEEEALKHLENKLGALEERILERKKERLLTEIGQAEERGESERLKELLKEFERNFF